MKWQRIILAINAVVMFITGSVLIVQHGDGTMIVLCFQLAFVNLILTDVPESRR